MIEECNFAYKHVLMLSNDYINLRFFVPSVRSEYEETNSVLIIRLFSKSPFYHLRAVTNPFRISHNLNKIFPLLENPKIRL